MIVTSKRAQLPMDTIVLVLILFAFATVGIISTMMSNNINDELQGDPDFSNESKAASEYIASNMAGWYDNGFVFILAILWLALLISSYFLDTHPVFFIITLLLMIIVFVIGGMLIEGFLEIAADPELGATADLMPKMMWIMEHWMIISIVLVISVMIALYSKFGGG